MISILTHGQNIIQQSWLIMTQTDSDLQNQSKLVKTGSLIFLNSLKGTNYKTTTYVFPRIFLHGTANRSFFTQSPSENPSPMGPFGAQTSMMRPSACTARRRARHRPSNCCCSAFSSETLDLFFRLDDLDDFSLRKWIRNWMAKMTVWDVSKALWMIPSFLLG